MSSYNMLGGLDNVITTFDQYHNLGEKEVGEHTKLAVLSSFESWWAKYHIHAGIKIYHEADLNSNPYLKDATVFYEGFRWAGIMLPLSPMAVLFFNYIGRAPQ